VQTQPICCSILSAQNVFWKKYEIAQSLRKKTLIAKRIGMDISK
jgi:hypothetical protein